MEMMVDFKRHLADLSLRERAFFFARHSLGLSYREMAEAWDCSPATCRRIVARVERNLLDLR